MENKQTAIQELIDELVEHLTYDDKLSDDSRITYETIRLRCFSKLNKEKEQMIDFALWLRNNDTQENAEMFANFSDIDMLNYYLNLKK
jgi:hypothetical protein